MKKITEIYQEYKVIKNLQLHQLRVAAIAAQICDSSTIPLNKNDLIAACLLHDIANIIKFDFVAFQDEFYAPLGKEYWKNVQDEFIARYGDNEHDATVKIIKELGKDNLASLVDKHHFSLFCKHKKEDDLNIKILHYVDSRVGPHGVLSYDDRMNEAEKRYENHGKGLIDNVPLDKRPELLECGKEIEKEIFSFSKISPEDITDDSVAPYIEELKNFQI